MKISLVVVNLIAALLVFPAIWGSCLLVGLYLSSSYTELDRAEVINHDKLREFSEDHKLGLRPNDRHKVPMWMFEPATYYKYVGIPCVLVFLLNALLVGVFM